MAKKKTQSEPKKKTKAKETPKTETKKTSEPKVEEKPVGTVLKSGLFKHKSHRGGTTFKFVAVQGEKGIDFFYGDPTQPNAIILKHGSPIKNKTIIAYLKRNHVKS